MSKVASTNGHEDGPRFPCPGPWSSGPGEILEFGVGLLEGDSDRDRRLGMILIDNAVELTLKVYAGLPKRTLGVHIPARQLDEMRRTFPLLLDGFEDHLPGALPTVLVSDIDWYHRLRNQLYHEGNGLTVERLKARAYADIATLLFERLFGGPDRTPTGVAPPSSAPAAPGTAWQGEFADGDPVKRFLALFMRFADRGRGELTAEHRRELEDFRAIRNEVAHGRRVPTHDEVDHLYRLMREIEDGQRRPREDPGR